jgi:hypothetical protein
VSSTQKRPLASLAPVLVGAGLAVIIFDTVGALASVAFRFSYGSLAPGSFVIYAGAGFFGASRRGWSGACLTGGATGLIDATIGWAISWALGPGRPVDGFMGPGTILVTIVMVTASAMILGLGGGLVERLLRRSR